MSLQTPTTQEISDQIIAGLEGSLSQTIPLLPKAFARVLAKVLAGVFVLIYKYCGFIFLQLFVAHASFRETTVLGVTLRPLVEWGKLIGVGEPGAATQAELVVDLPVVTQVGSLAAGTQFVRSETGIVYVSIAAVPLDAPIKQVTIRASSDQEGGDGSGAIGNLEAGDIVSLANAPAAVAGEATVVSQSVTGADAESADDYRAKVLRRFQAKPQGGAYADYREWAESVAGIVHAYPYTSDDPGEVDVYVEATEASSGSPDGIPTGAQLTAVADAIELDDAGLATRRPANAAVNVFAITRTAFDLEVTGLTPDTPDLRTAIQEGVDEHLRSREPFIVGLSVFPRKDRITQAEIGGIVASIAHAAGASVAFVTLAAGQAQTLGQGEKAKLGNPTYV